MRSLSKFAILLALFSIAVTAGAQGAKKYTGIDCTFFVLKDCPIANQYAPEMKRIIAEYEKKGVTFGMVFEDQDLSLEEATRHAREYGFKCAMIADKDHRMAKKAGATVSPTAFVSHRNQKIYTGRIDDQYAGIGKRRAKVSSRDLRNALDAALAGKPAPAAKGAAIGCRLY